MTGMDVLRRVRAYEKDIGKLKLRRMCAYELATGATRAAGAPGSSSGSGRSDKPERYSAEVDAVDRAIGAREKMREMEVMEAARLIMALDPAQGQAMYLYYVRAMTVRQTAGQMKTSESSVRGLLRRGRDTLDAEASALNHDEVYRMHYRAYAQNDKKEGRSI